VFSVLVRRKPRADDSARADLLPNFGVSGHGLTGLLAPAFVLAVAVLLAGCVTNNPDRTTTGTTRLAAAASVPAHNLRAHTVRAHAPRGRAAARPVIPLPDPALLKRQPPPDCQLNTQPAGVTPADVKLATLDYERQCYRQVEGVVRTRLDALQDAVGKTVRAVKDAAGPQ
jgi:hypothetical protein